MKKIILFVILVFGVCFCREFAFNYNVTFTQTEGKFEAWIPIPQTNEVQEISSLNIEASCQNVNYKINIEKVHGNKYLYLWKSDGLEHDTDVTVSFNVTRIEHNNIIYKNVDQNNYLGSYFRVPVGYIFSDIIKINNLTNKNVREVYDFVLLGMHYGKPEGGKWGNGDAIYACKIGIGNCTDFHSYFMSLSRTLKIPSRFHMGFPIPDGEGGIVEGYHCWADYYVDGEGWYPVDISEADKHPEKTDYFFGTIDENRVEFIIGRDFELEGYTDTVNLFIYPLLEIDDKKSNNFTKSFLYKNN